MPCDFTHMWNLRNKTKKEQKRQKTRLLSIENKLVATEWRWGAGGMGETGDED